MRQGSTHRYQPRGCPRNRSTVRRVPPLVGPVISGDHGAMDARILPRLFLALAAFAATTHAPAHAASAITLGITSATAFSIPHYIAEEKKFYAAEGLSVDTIVAGSAASVLQQLAAGSLNIGAGRDRPDAARHPARRADPHHRGRRLERAVPHGGRQGHEGLGRAQGQEPSASAA